MFSKSSKYQKKKAKGFPEAKLAWFNIADQLKSATAVSIPRGVKYSEELPFLVSSPPKVESKIKNDFFYNPAMFSLYIWTFSFIFR